jgi:AraC family transcriptional regulator
MSRGDDSATHTNAHRLRVTAPGPNGTVAAPPPVVHTRDRRDGRFASDPDSDDQGLRGARAGAGNRGASSVQGTLTRRSTPAVDPARSTDLHLKLLAIGRATIEPDWWYGDPIGYPFWRLYLAESDGVYLAVDGQIHALPAERLCFLPAALRCARWTEESIDLIFVHFEVIGLPTILLEDLVTRPIVLPQLTELENALRRVDDRDWFTPPDLTLSCSVKAIVYGALSTWVESITARRLAEASQRAELLEPLMPAMALIEDHLGKRVTNSDLARACYMSEDHFIKLFHARVGQSPARYVRERTLDRAAELLLCSDVSIDAIAFSCGFSSRSAFSKSFAQHHGVPPGAYRHPSSQRMRLARTRIGLRPSPLDHGRG